MSDKEYEIPVKVVDRRWWAKQDAENVGGTEARNPLKPTYVEELEQKLAEKDQQLQEAIARYRDASAEFEGARLRLRREIGKDIQAEPFTVAVTPVTVWKSVYGSVEARDRIPARARLGGDRVANVMPAGA